MAKKQTHAEKSATKYVGKHKPGRVGILGKGTAGFAGYAGYQNARSEGYSRTQSAGVGAATAAPVYAGMHGHSRKVHKAYSHVAETAKGSPGTIDKLPKVKTGRIAAGIAGGVVAEHAAMSGIRKHKIASNDGYG